VVYEAFRAPVFVPAHLRVNYGRGRFKLFVNRSEFNGTDEEYEQQLPGQFMDKWVNELQTAQIVRLVDELITPGAKLPQYLFMQHCEYVWRMQVRSNAVYQIFVKKQLSRYYEKVDDFFYWNRLFAKEQVDYIYKKDLWKLKPEYEDRMIRAGYGKDMDNKSLGKYFDIERAFHGYPGPLTKKFNHLFDPRKHLPNGAEILDTSQHRV